MLDPDTGLGESRVRSGIAANREVVDGLEFGVCVANNGGPAGVLIIGEPAGVFTLDVGVSESRVRSGIAANREAVDGLEFGVCVANNGGPVGVLIIGEPADVSEPDAGADKY